LPSLSALVGADEFSKHRRVDELDDREIGDHELVHVEQPGEGLPERISGCQVVFTAENDHGGIPLGMYDLQIGVHSSLPPLSKPSP
jgi:hypothetical protein